MLSLACEGARDALFSDETRVGDTSWWAADVVTVTANVWTLDSGVWLEWHVKVAVVLSALGFVPDFTPYSEESDAAASSWGKEQGRHWPISTCVLNVWVWLPLSNGALSLGRLAFVLRE